LYELTTLMQLLLASSASAAVKVSTRGSWKKTLHHMDLSAVIEEEGEQGD
jgi:hypothetical protein